MDGEFGKVFPFEKSPFALLFLSIIFVLYLCFSKLRPLTCFLKLLLMSQDSQVVGVGRSSSSCIATSLSLSMMGFKNSNLLKSWSDFAHNVRLWLQ